LKNRSNISALQRFKNFVYTPETYEKTRAKGLPVVRIQVFLPFYTAPGTAKKDAPGRNALDTFR